MMRSAPERRHEPRRHDAHRRRSDHDPAHGVYAHDGRARDGLAVRPSGAAAGAPAAAARSCELEAQERHERRITRLRRASKLPPGKTFATLDEGRLPPALVRQLHELAEGDFLADATNVLAFGLPGVGKSHAMCAVGHALVDRGHAVLFMPTYSLVQELLAAKRNLELPRALRKLDHFAVLLLDDVGYIQQSPEEAEILFTLLAERYERRSVCHHEQFDLRAVGSDLSRSDGDGRGDRSPGASLGAAGIRCPQLPDRAREAAGETHAKPTGGRLVTETTAQDASGATIAVWDGLRVDLVFTTREVERACGSARIDTRDRSNDRAAHGKRPWTLPDPWTHRTRPPVLGKPRTVSHSAHRHHRS